jgi:hypothetical protein
MPAQPHVAAFVRRRSSGRTIAFVGGSGATRLLLWRRSARPAGPPGRRLRGRRGRSHKSGAAHALLRRAGTSQRRSVPGIGAEGEARRGGRPDARVGGRKPSCLFLNLPAAGAELVRSVAARKLPSSRHRGGARAARRPGSGPEYSSAVTGYRPPASAARDGGYRAPVSRDWLFIDGSSLIFRAYCGFLGMTSTADGLQVNAIGAFLERGGPSHR